MTSMVSVIHAGGNKKHEKTMSKKKMSGVVTIDQTQDGKDYTLNVEKKGQAQRKQVDLKFTDEVQNSLPEDGEEITVRGHFSDSTDQFLVTTINPQEYQRNQNQGQTQSRTQGQM